MTSTGQTGNRSVTFQDMKNGIGLNATPPLKAIFLAQLYEADKNITSHLTSRAQVSGWVGKISFVGDPNSSYLYLLPIFPPQFERMRTTYVVLRFYPLGAR